mmetsp:Transcript_89151/g.212858  ORF Transcript_89151/g.212858 Transcript_89151/m.212858 type:complete len:478 (-) Transcript_89151:1832-3265(-)
MRRWRYQPHPWGGFPRLCDLADHLVARQLTALAGLGALGQLDLQLVGVGQILRCDAKAAGGDLLDLRTEGVPSHDVPLDAASVPLAHVQVGKAQRVLSALAGVTLAPDAVHGDGHGPVGLVADGSERGCASAEALHDLHCRLHLVQRHRIALVRPKLKLTPDLRLLRNLVLPSGEHLVGLRGVVLSRLLHLVNNIRSVHMDLRLMDAAEVILPKVLQLLHLGIDQWGLRPVREGHLVQLHRIHLEDVETCAIEHKLAAGEALGDDFLVHAHRLEKLRALVALQTGDAHLAHDLQDPSVRGLAEVLDALVEGEVGPPDAEQAEVAKVGVDGVTAKAKEAAEVMDLMGIGSFHDQGDLRTELLGNQVLMHGTHGEERADRHATLTGAAVREDEDGGAIAQDRCFGLLADLLQALLQQVVSAGCAVRLPGSRLRLAKAIGHVQHDGRHTVSLQTEESVVAVRAEDRGVQEDTPAGLRGGL